MEYLRTRSIGNQIAQPQQTEPLQAEVLTIQPEQAVVDSHSRQTFR